jgi:hypothetical protein
MPVSSSGAACCRCEHALRHADTDTGRSRDAFIASLPANRQSASNVVSVPCATGRAFIVGKSMTGLPRSTRPAKMQFVVPPMAAALSFTYS